ncbi:glutamine amidotransferase-related protein [Parvularcula sp. LCG005]|uniref:type 1 glutamine amidotransferase n=1 Tax=Parvularcula sp. LCG005 TaxID=3078805 RepID=UPI002941D1F2|nr:hypothetical protein [Parvularcula sp. LCG005]WOI52644.1 hypothetical protein RUI03_10845 [Parvularcula sp. LCG005]
MTSTIVIAETGRAPGSLFAEYGGYDRMMLDMLERAGHSFSTRTVAVLDGERLMPPNPGEALIVTGSPAGVYDDHEWIAPLAQSVREWASAGAPMVGICFGHQLMAHAFGGEVIKSPKGWGVGVHTYDVVGEAPWQNGPVRFSCAVSHQDQVVALPAGAQRIAGSPFCPNGVIRYADGPALSFQMHPEFSHEFARDLLHMRRDSIGEDVAGWALPTFDHPSDRGAMADWIGQFLKGKSQ